MPKVKQEQGLDLEMVIRSSDGGGGRKRPEAGGEVVTFFWVAEALAGRVGDMQITRLGGAGEAF